MKFRSWVEKQGGAESVASLLKIQGAVVRAWLRKDSAPRLPMLQKLVRLGNGKFSFDDVINETAIGRKKK